MRSVQYCCTSVLLQFTILLKKYNVVSALLNVHVVFAYARVNTCVLQKQTKKHKNSFTTKTYI